MTVNEACWRYWNEIGQHLKDSGKAFQLECIRRLLGSDTRLKDLTKDKIAEAIVKRAAEPNVRMVRKNPHDLDDRSLVPKVVGTLTGARINRSFIRPLSALLNRAESHWDVPVNPRRFPWKDWLYPDSTPVVRELSAAEEERVWAAIRPDYMPILWFLANNGVRVGGALSMRKSRSNLERRETWVKKKTKARGEHWSRVKLSPAAVAVIATEMQKWKGDEIWTYEVQRGKDRGERVPITYAALRRATDTALKRAGVKDFRRHDLRHDFASKLLRSTKNLKLVSEKLHHSSIALTAKFYAHVLDEEVVAGTELVEASRNYAGKGLAQPDERSQKK
jgi:integrase